MPKKTLAAAVVAALAALLLAAPAFAGHGGRAGSTIIAR
jgi:hypothetical protein